MTRVIHNSVSVLTLVVITIYTPRTTTCVIMTTFVILGTWFLRCVTTKPVFWGVLFPSYGMCHYDDICHYNDMSDDDGSINKEQTYFTIVMTFVIPTSCYFILWRVSLWRHYDLNVSDDMSFWQVCYYVTQCHFCDDVCSYHNVLSPSDDVRLSSRFHCCDGITEAVRTLLRCTPVIPRLTSLTLLLVAIAVNKITIEKNRYRK